MKQRPAGRPSWSEKIIRDIKRKTRKQYSAEEKIRIVLDGLRGEDSIAELCRREGIAQSLYYKWTKDFMEAGKKRLAGNTIREATSSEVKELVVDASAKLQDLTLRFTRPDPEVYSSGVNGSRIFAEVLQERGMPLHD